MLHQVPKASRIPLSHPKFISNCPEIIAATQNDILAYVATVFTEPYTPYSVTIPAPFDEDLLEVKSTSNHVHNILANKTKETNILQDVNTRPPLYDHISVSSPSSMSAHHEITAYRKNRQFYDDPVDNRQLNDALVSLMTPKQQRTSPLRPIVEQNDPISTTGQDLNIRNESRSSLSSYQHPEGHTPQPVCKSVREKNERIKRFIGTREADK
jgi:hypothetical protein